MRAENLRVETHTNNKQIDLKKQRCEIFASGQGERHLKSRSGKLQSWRGRKFVVELSTWQTKRIEWFVLIFSAFTYFKIKFFRKKNKNKNKNNRD